MGIIGVAPACAAYECGEDQNLKDACAAGCSLVGGACDWACGAAEDCYEPCDDLPAGLARDGCRSDCNLIYDTLSAIEQASGKIGVECGC